MSGKYTKIFSGNRVNASTTSPSDCNIPLNDVMEGRYALKAIKLPVTYHNINAFNNKVYFTDTGGAHTATIPEQYYSSFNSVATALATAMTAAGAGTVTCAVASGTNVITVTSTVNFTFTFGTNTTNSAATVLGFVGDSTSSTTAQTGTQTMNLNFTLSYNFVIDDASTEVREAGYGCTLCIPALTTTPNEAYYEPTLHFPMHFTVKSTKQLHIKILDDHFRVLNNMTSDFYMIVIKIGE